MMEKPTQTAADEFIFLRDSLACSMQINSFSFTGVSAPGEVWLQEHDPSLAKMQMAWQMAAGYASFPDAADICTIQPSGPSLLLNLQFNEHIFMGDVAVCWFRTIRSS